MYVCMHAGKPVAGVDCNNCLKEPLVREYNQGIIRLKTHVALADNPSWESRF